jgi:iron complex outermembrane receptor protein
VNWDLRSQEKERLLFEEIPVVITPSRKEQPITEAPTTVALITTEDIRYSGATTIPDLLRMVAGIDVMTITARDQVVGIRGFTDPLGKRLLVLMDGRSVYMDLFDLVYWDAFPVSLEEIARIEVVKSPSSALYGANAFSGVINIITKSPEQLKGTTLRLTAGTRDTFIGSIIHSGNMASNKIKYKVSLELDKTNEWSEDLREKIDGRKEAGEIERLNVFFSYKPNDKFNLEISGNKVHIKNRLVLFNEPFGAGKLKNNIDSIQVNMEFKNLEFRMFHRKEDGDNFWIGSQDHQLLATSLYDFELLHSQKLGKNKQHSLIMGINYRYNKLIEHDYFLEDHLHNLWAFFIENELRITDKLRLTVGGRYDHHPLVGGRFSPRGNILFYPCKNNIIRFSVSRAFHNPSFSDFYMYNEVIFIPPSHSIPPISFIVEGNQNLAPEAITAYEIQYRSTWSNILKLDTSLFYYRYSNFIQPNSKLIYYDADEAFPGSPGGVFIKKWVASLWNSGRARGIGGEVSLNFFLNRGSTAFLNYSYQEITDKEDDIYTSYVNEKNRIRSEYPRHKVNAGVRILFKNNISINLLAHWVDKTQRFIVDHRGEYIFSSANSYCLINPSMGYTFPNKKIEVVLSVFNLFNNKHYQYPVDAASPTPHSDQIGTKITFTVKFKF